MKLHELQKALESDAKKQVAQQKDTIEGLHNHIRSLEQEIEEKEHSCQQLMNRCMAQTRGAICLFCGFRPECGAYEDAMKQISKSHEEYQ